MFFTNYISTVLITKTNVFYWLLKSYFLFFNSYQPPIFARKRSMSAGGYKITNPAATHFITFAVVDWVDVFTRAIYKDIFLDSIKHCQEHRGLIVNAWCLMTNHIHLIFSARQKDPGAILRDLKKHTSKEIVAAIENNKHESRREWMLRLFKEAGKANSRNSGH